MVLMILESEAERPYFGNNALLTSSTRRHFVRVEVWVVYLWYLVSGFVEH